MEAKRRRVRDEEDGVDPSTEEMAALDPDQTRFLELAAAGKNIFLTGAAGCGKSMCIKLLRKMLGSKTVELTATTGTAAGLLECQTLHSACCLGILDKTKRSEIEQEIWDRSRWQRAKDFFKQTRILVIDEVSMLSPNYFYLIDGVARNARERRMEPFGGIQLILCGDFYQLLCFKSKDPVRFSDRRGAAAPGFLRNNPDFDPDTEELKCAYAFETDLWKKVIEETVVLKTIHRQTDKAFLEILGRIRTGTMISSDHEFLRARICPDNQDSSPTTRLYPHRETVKMTNEAFLRRLSGKAKSWTYSTMHIVNPDAPGDAHLPDERTIESIKKTMIENARADNVLTLKEGAFVVLVHNANVDAGLFNGAAGRVISMEGEYPTCRFPRLGKTIDDPDANILCVTPHAFETNVGKWTKVVYIQVPLTLGYARTVHSGQGSTLNSVRVSLARCFAPGQAYVAISRARTPEGLQICDYVENSVKVDPLVTKFYDTI